MICLFGIVARHTEIKASVIHGKTDGGNFTHKRDLCLKTRFLGEIAVHGRRVSRIGFEITQQIHTAVVQIDVIDTLAVGHLNLSYIIRLRAGI